MRPFLAALTVVVCFGALGTFAWAQHITFAPEGVDIVPSEPVDRVPCSILLQYDDGTDDNGPGGTTMGWYDPVLYQFVGVRFTPAGDQPYLVQSASWYSDFWVTPGNVDVEAQEWGNPSNSTSATIYVTGAGTWEVEFANPICVPQGGEYVIMLCPQQGVWGVVGDDLSAPHGRSYWAWTAGCSPQEQSTGEDYMIRSCVTSCGTTPVEDRSWGRVKILYR
jgi:hypothetical protein